MLPRSVTSRSANCLLKKIHRINPLTVTAILNVIKPDLIIFFISLYRKVIRLFEYISDSCVEVCDFQRLFKMFASHIQSCQCGNEQIRPNQSYAIRKIIEKFRSGQIKTESSIDTFRKSSLQSFG